MKLWIRKEIELLEKGFGSENEGEKDSENLSSSLSLSPRESDKQSSNSKHGFTKGVCQCGFMGSCASVVPWWPKETGVEKEMGHCLKRVR
jgi:hypothetical protein